MALYRRGKSKVWWINVSHDGKRVRRSTDTTNKQLAEKIHAKVFTEIVEGRWFDVDEGKKRTFEELAQKYEEVFMELKSWRSVESYLKQLREFFGPYKLSDIDTPLIDDFKRMRKKKGVTKATINRQLNIIKRMFNLAKKRWKWVKEVPDFEMEPKADKKRTRHLSFEEYHTLLEHCDDWLRNIVIFAAWTGLRQGNILNLTRNQVNLQAALITVEADEMKNEESLCIPVAKPAFDILKEAMKVVHLKSAYVFCYEDGKPYHKRVVQRAFKNAVEQAGIDDFRFHDLRHCFASWNRQAGVDIDTLADLLGHKDTRMTRRYAHITTDHLRRAVNRLESTYDEAVTNLPQINKKGLSR